MTARANSVVISPQSDMDAGLNQGCQTLGVPPSVSGTRGNKVLGAQVVQRRWTGEEETKRLEKMRGEKEVRTHTGAACS